MASAEVGLLSDLELFADLRDLVSLAESYVRSTQLRNDLFRRVSCSLHLRILSGLLPGCNSLIQPGLI